MLKNSEIRWAWGNWQKNVPQYGYPVNFACEKTFSENDVLGFQGDFWVAEFFKTISPKRKLPVVSLIE